MRNLPLILGAAIAALFVGLALIGPAIAPHDPMEVVETMRVDGTTYGAPPLRALQPFEHPDYPLGLDRVNRDVVSRLLWAVRPTLIICLTAACVRMATGMLIGLLAGVMGRRMQGVIDSLVTISGAIPLLLVAMAVLMFDRNTPTLWDFVLAAGLTGWIPTAALVQSRVQAVLRAPYIESAVAIGQHRLGIYWRHVVPQLWPILPLLLAAELSAVTLLVAELGYMGLFVDGGFLYADFGNDFSPAPTTMIPTTGTPELGQMLADVFGQINRTPWMPVFGGAMVVLMLIGWTLLSEGLRRELDVTRPRAIWWPWRRGKRAKPAAQPLQQEA